MSAHGPLQQSGKWQSALRQPLQKPTQTHRRQFISVSAPYPGLVELSNPTKPPQLNVLEFWQELVALCKSLLQICWCVQITTTSRNSHASVSLTIFLGTSPTYRASQTIRQAFRTKSRPLEFSSFLVLPKWNLTLAASTVTTYHYKWPPVATVHWT